MGWLMSYRRCRIHKGDLVFQQGNARIHTAGNTMAWFEDNNVEVMELPACSPDLNPIEHCCEH